MRALTLHQPWASLVAAGAKTIETRGWRTSYRGPLAIHAGRRQPKLGEVRPFGHDLQMSWCSIGQACAPCDPVCGDCTVTALRALPLGAVVATADLVDCVPMESIVWHRPPERLDGEPLPRENHGWLTAGPSWRMLFVLDEDPAPTPFVAEVERPFGDFTPGRWAWLLADIKPTGAPVPARGRQGLWTWDRA